MYSRSRNNKKQSRVTTITSPVDRSLIIIISCIVMIGLMAVFSASVSHGIQDYNDHLYFLKKQFKHIGIGAAALWFFTKFNYMNFQKLASPIAYLTIMLLGLTLVIGDSIYGSTRWLFGFQPSELAKFSCVVLMADGLVNSKNIMENYFLKRAFSIVIILGLILMQPDLSTTVIVFATCIAVCFAGGISWNLMFSGIVSFLGVAFFSIMHRIHQSDRIVGWLDPWSDPYNKGYNLIQSWYAISAGGFWGVGFGNSKQKLLWLPLGHIDFIFAIFAEELGFLGCIVLLGLFLAFMHRGFSIAKKCPDHFGRLLAFGVTFAIVFQALINICVAVGLLPVTGVTLPLISYGGTSVIVTMSMMGVLLNISRLKIKRINSNAR